MFSFFSQIFYLQQITAYGNARWHSLIFITRHEQTQSNIVIYSHVLLFSLI